MGAFSSVASSLQNTLVALAARQVETRAASSTRPTSAHPAHRAPAGRASRSCAVRGLRSPSTPPHARSSLTPRIRPGCLDTRHSRRCGARHLTRVSCGFWHDVDAAAPSRDVTQPSLLVDAGVDATCRRDASGMIGECCATNADCLVGECCAPDFADVPDRRGESLHGTLRIPVGRWDGGTPSTFPRRPAVLPSQ